MTFPYWRVHRGTDVRLLPLVPLTILGNKAPLHLVALVDSGAEHNVMGTAVAERLGLTALDAAPAVSVVGVGEQVLPGRMLAIELQLGHAHWRAPVIFSPAVSGRAILGQAGFFAFFTVTFRQSRGVMDITRVRGRQ